MPYAALATTEPTPYSDEQKMRPPALHPANAAPMHILLAEDDASDIMLTECALDAANIDYALYTLTSGTEVMPYLRRQGRYHGEPQPQLLMLDLSMPGKDGFEVLAELSTKPERFGHLPIVILTGDTQCAFLKESYGLNIAAYITKPCTAEKIQNALTNLTTRGN